MYFPVYTAVDLQPWGEGAADAGCHLSHRVQDHWPLAEADSIRAASRAVQCLHLCQLTQCLPPLLLGKMSTLLQYFCLFFSLASSGRSLLAGLIPHYTWLDFYPVSLSSVLCSQVFSSSTIQLLTFSHSPQSTRAHRCCKWP